MREKATAAGSCQACGRVQKLPKGVLSKHGYAVRWNQFVGECPGSGHLPYEQSCKLIKSFIANAKESRARIQARIDELNKPALEPKAWFAEYVPATWQDRHSRYEDREVTLFVEAPEPVTPEIAQRNKQWVALMNEGKAGNGTAATKHSDDYVPQPTIFWFNLKGERVNAFTHSVNSNSVLETATKMNQKFAEHQLAPRVKQLDEYIRWQQQRVTDWKLAPLRDLKEVR
jgi:uncharacterized protein YeaC (DUF1315 family)